MERHDIVANVFVEQPQTASDLVNENDEKPQFVKLQRIFRHGSFILLILLLTLQYVLLIFSPWRKNFQSDEQYYVGRAMTFLATGSASDTGGLQFRPAGYSIAIAAFNFFDWTPDRIRYRTATTQFALMSSVMLALFLIAASILKSSRSLYASAFLMGIQPWTFASTKILYPDSLTASLFSIGLVCLFGFLKVQNRKTQLLFFFASIVALSLTVTLRAEMAVLVVTFLVIALSLKYFRKIALIVIIVSLAAIAFVAFEAHEQLLTSGKFGKFGILKKGAYEWVGTWFATERSGFKHFLYGDLDLFKFQRLPSYAFDDDTERAEVRGAIELIERSKKYTPDSDVTFRALAQKRKSEHLWMNHILPYTWASLSMWININTNEQLWESLLDRKYLFRMMVVSFALLKVIVFSLAIVSAFRLFQRIRGRQSRWYDDLTMLMLVCIISRTLLMGEFLGYIHRYVLPAWPAMIWCAVSAFFHPTKQTPSAAV